ncbi:uncharacterized protein MONBRDRAFT_15339 [Monosiga brevicollis MX1]|uniref:tRNA uridine 5-carboxymethylaminomethyl modification enzyme C-terminal subdomain domain-containing protein n=1 Tax=Monosiga brevicollis TaxID=81824 RepID=A9UTK9_MONBE|nr:uncharacterized protein MONBRDRAFT_15339 [Monosiga brevicollis MX1]EDQ91263.1 predicted protein [Monosiga brevicollis MX1]|eukprot:XP_001743685.1 hypothetical protein [Monosiga brevicollis MX1]
MSWARSFNTATVVGSVRRQAPITLATRRSLVHTTATAIPKDLRYDVVVIGGGHAGCEAAAAAARTGARTALVTQKLETIGEMSCNPSFGGVGKGILLREVDALGGVAPTICDRAGIHFRVLNRSKGPAVWGPRAQIDRSIYRSEMQQHMASQPNLDLIAAAVEDITVNGDHQVTGVALGNGQIIGTRAVVVTTGTFLRGVINIGAYFTPAGRKGEGPSVGLAQTLETFGFKLGRLRTGTPPRIKKSTVCFDGLLEQPSDYPATPFSYLNERVALEDSFIQCHLTHTNSAAHQLVHDTLHENNHVRQDALGPRYCPSIESKANRHQVWLEPEGLDSDVIYPNGISMTMPEEAQLRFVRSIAGLENAQITQLGYGVSYDFVDPRQLHRTLETKMIHSLFLAGQINGTTGYEEAASQGIIAGINAALKVRGEPSFTVDRTQAYIGVLIDDLVTKGVLEPYRMFTSRAEYRLSLRSDNADTRLTALGHACGAVDEPRFQHFCQQQKELAELTQLLESVELTPHEWNSGGWYNSLRCGLLKPCSVASMMAFGFVSDSTAADLVPALRSFNPRLVERVKIEAMYAHMMNRQRASAESYRRQASLEIPPGFAFEKVHSLPLEALERLREHAPRTIGDAAQIQGITPDALARLVRALQS